MHILTNPTDDDIVQAIEGNMLARYLLYRHCPEIEVHDDAEMLWTLSGLRFATFNTVHRARMTADQCDQMIANVMRRGRSRGVPLLWWVGPLTRPLDLGSRLVDLGWKQGEEQPGMAVDLAGLRAPSLPSDFRFERVLSLAGLTTWWEIACEVNGRPHDIVPFGARLYAAMASQADSALQCYVGYLGDRPVATACLVLGAGVAGLYGVGTLPYARRRGLGTEMTLSALHRAREMGYRLGVLRASAQGAPLYRRLGFREHCRINTYLWEDRTDDSAQRLELNEPERIARQPDNAKARHHGHLRQMEAS